MLRRRSVSSRVAGVDAVDEDPAGRRLDEPVDHLERRRLAAAGRPDEAADLAGRDHQRQVVDGARRRRALVLAGRGVVALRDVVELDDRGLTRLLGHRRCDPPAGRLAHGCAAWSRDTVPHPGSRRRYCPRMQHHRDPARPPDGPARPAVPGGLGSGAADRRSPVTIVRVETDEGVVGDRLRRHDGRVRGLRAPVRRPGSAGDRPPRPGRSRRSTSTPAATGRSRRRCGTSPARSPDCRSRRCSAARPTGSRPTPRAGCCCRRPSGPSRALRLREEGFRALKIRVDPRRLDEGLAAVAATRDAVGDDDGDHGRPQPGLADGRRHVAPSIDSGDGPVDRRAARRARRPVARGAARRARTCAGLAALRAAVPGIRIAGGEMTRTFAESLAALDADAFDVYQPDVVLAAGMLRTRTVAELALARNRWFTPAHVDERDRAAREPPRRGGRRRRAVPRVPVRPAGLDPGAPRRVPRRADPARTATASSACPTRPGSGSSSTRPRSGGTRHDGDADARRRADRRGLDSRAPPRSRRGPSCSSTAGSCRRPPAGRSPTSRAGTARRSPHVAEGGARGRRPGRRRGPRARSTTAAGPTSTPADRKRVLLRLAELIAGEPRRARAARVARRRQADPRHARGRRPDRRRRRSSGTPRRSTRSTARSGRPGPDALSLVTREPIGVVAAIVPWNYPLIITAWKLGRGARDRQLGRPQAGVAVAADGAPPGGAGRRRRACRTAS